MLAGQLKLVSQRLEAGEGLLAIAAHHQIAGHATLLAGQLLDLALLRLQLVGQGLQLLDIVIDREAADADGADHQHQ